MATMRESCQWARRGVARTTLAGLCVVVASIASNSSAALAQSPSELRLCPATIVHTCVIGYVSAPSRLVIMLSSKDNDPLVGDEVDILATPPNSTVKSLDLSMHLGSVVMLDAIAADRLYAAKLVSVADPLLTALYLSMYMQPMSAGVPPR